MGASDDDLVGTILDGRYRVEAAIGTAQGGGTVYRGRDASSGTPVVVRCPRVSPELLPSEHEDALDAFLHEASILAQICQRSTDVERLLASGLAVTMTPAKIPFTIFEWLSGHSLERHVEERKGNGASIGEALVILEPAARALSVAHELGVTHGDVRPANLWLAEMDGRTTLKVAAFGLATSLDRPSSAGEPTVRAFAPEYGAPEQFKRSYGAVGAATDVYGLALCLIELMTGKRALEGKDAADFYVATSDLARRPTLRARGLHVSDALEAVMQRALAVDPKRRWATARELWDALVAAVPELTPAPSSARMDPKSDRSPWTPRPSTTPPPLPSSPKADAEADGTDRRVSQRPASVLAGTANPTSSVSLPPAEDARLGDSIRVGPLSPKDATAVDRSGTWAWLAVATLGVVAVGVVVAKVGGERARGPKAPAVDAATSEVVEAGPPSAKAAKSIDEDAVAVQPFTTDMVKVPPGTFSMGSGREANERPAHRVTITRPFFIDRTEVTAEAYAACVEDGACAPNRVHSGDVVTTAYGCNTGKDRPRHPANCVDRMQAEKYCTFVGKRLPTEAEWEYAARGSDGRDYPWGNATPTKCTMAILLFMTGECGDHKGTWEVGTTTEGEGPFGTYDMAGNVWEWVADGFEPYPSDDVTDPQVALAPNGKGVLRGGSWDYATTSAKATYRYPFQSISGNVSLGFRCARTGP